MTLDTLLGVQDRRDYKIRDWLFEAQKEWNYANVVYTNRLYTQTSLIHGETSVYRRIIVGRHLTKIQGVLW